MSAWCCLKLKCLGSIIIKLHKHAHTLANIYKKKKKLNKKCCSIIISHSVLRGCSRSRIGIDQLICMKNVVDICFSHTMISYLHLVIFIYSEDLERTRLLKLYYHRKFLALPFVSLSSPMPHSSSPLTESSAPSPPP